MTTWHPKVDDDCENDPIQCPYCANDYVHIEGAAQQIGWEGRDHEVLDRILSPGPPREVLLRGTRHGMRGTAYVLRGFCESCTTIFDLVFAFHKGQTFFSIRKVGVSQGWPKDVWKPDETWTSNFLDGPSG